MKFAFYAFILVVAFIYDGFKRRGNRKIIRETFLDASQSIKDKTRKPDNLEIKKKEVFLRCYYGLKNDPKIKNKERFSRTQEQYLVKCWELIQSDDPAKKSLVKWFKTHKVEKAYNNILYQLDQAKQEASNLAKTGMTRKQALKNKVDGWIAEFEARRVSA